MDKEGDVAVYAAVRMLSETTLPPRLYPAYVPAKPTIRGRLRRRWSDIRARVADRIGGERYYTEGCGD